jgi:hypothetical protein
MDTVADAVILGLGKLRQEHHHGLGATLGYLVSPRSAFVTWKELLFKKKGGMVLK